MHFGCHNHRIRIPSNISGINWSSVPVVDNKYQIIWQLSNNPNKAVFTCLSLDFGTTMILSCRNRMIVGFTTTFAISAYHQMLWVRISIRARCTTLCDKVCRWLVTGRWFSPGTSVSLTNKTDRHDITEILLKVALNTETSK